MPSPAMNYGVPALQVSSKGKRFGALLLDGLLMLVTLFIGWIIWNIVLWGKGQSPAKKLLKMRVVMKDEHRHATRGDMALREIVGKWLLGFVPLYTLVSGIVLLVDDGAQAVWDKIAKTVVVDDPDNHFRL
jgi:uncharacterized RDD family membrane protein YckC